ncbi:MULTISPECIES: HeH/LEM domain-containing protein [Pseudomonas]|uniref:HeH/LEM domain-containing protein n=1 Tax=Pseudomonas auratipiscis TaxID=3115853 RepID=A0AB35X191_9PSED|nr:MULTISPECIES: HeH/LEM domain-containing protein [unclassified Pseudomonas]MEE1869076.1 HeH/LEM domain-containing protein [Pseudomonas sp. 120P]MEE1959723.1 HeH/LEM domain-containing protein [Pseudomonas sp. 119P]
MKVIYTNSPGSERGTCYRRLDQFFGVIDGATSVSVQGEAPHIGEAYQRQGISVSEIEEGLRLDGPTITQWVAEGYKASAYPPAGYASVSSQAEIDKAIEAEGGDDETDPHKMKVPQLKEWLTAQGITFDAALNKPDLQALIPKE